MTTNLLQDQSSFVMMIQQPPATYANETLSFPFGIEPNYLTNLSVALVHCSLFFIFGVDLKIILRSAKISENGI